MDRAAIVTEALASRAGRSRAMTASLLDELERPLGGGVPAAGDIICLELWNPADLAGHRPNDALGIVGVVGVVDRRRRHKRADDFVSSARRLLPAA